jgi:hypothetical protein
VISAVAVVSVKLPITVWCMVIISSMLFSIEYDLLGVFYAGAFVCDKISMHLEMCLFFHF